ncbi:hypothetical protein [Hespellia stercorisuis]|uniref:Uncharacterized protein n=1 Tax=Hespellia stercorisuis DSM 15480 TaxID=1121950 RepID=A0A1M6TAI1_9FIRM|nr:hypothetical protein [Hespellia stercorisuis]SHK53995.1 hypothetical protein SAMN02745243_03172 [Hespellia stercorisuis DSM 15480]
MRTIGKEDIGISEIHLMTQLTADFSPDEISEHEEYDTDYGEPLTGADLAQYEDAITEAIDIRNGIGEEGQVCNLMDYCNEHPDLQAKVESAIVSVKQAEGILYGCTTLQLRESLEGDDLERLCDYITGQYSDGWGEGFEQQDIKVDGGTLNVHFWQPVDYALVASQRENNPAQKEQKPTRPQLKLIGHDGNIFAILSSAKRLLRRNGQGKEAKEMVERVMNSGDYYKALGIISEYVETELSQPQAVNKNSKKKPERGGDCR